MLDRKKIECPHRLEKAIELKPDSYKAWTDKSVALIGLGRYREALNGIEKAIDLNPNDASVWYNCACVYSLMSNKGEGLSKLKKAIEIDPSWKEDAKKDEDFKWLWDDADFKKLVELESGD